MRIAPPYSLPSRRKPPPDDWEVVLRYFCATAATLISIAAAQLVIPNSLAWILVGITLAGLPVSLYLRFTQMHIGPIRIPRPLWNSLTVIGACAGSIYFVFWSMRDLFIAWLNGSNIEQAFWLHFSAGDSVALLMQSFLMFAAARSFAIISDKDATLATVPSFSVLLLLIPVHKGIEVVIYFLLWTGVAAMLFALDHRSEARQNTVGYVPSLTPGQEARLSARGLASVLAFSLFTSIAFSYYISSRDPDQRSAAETAVTALASRLTQFALSLPAISVNAGPDRQIDFSSAPTPPSRSLLWQAQAQLVEDRRFIRPSYWRMFTLAHYDGSTWTQLSGQVIEVKRTVIDRNRLPIHRRRGPGQNNDEEGHWRPSFTGFDLSQGPKEPLREFGSDGVTTVVRILATSPNIGYLPVLPSTRVVVMPDAPTGDVRVRHDGAVDIGIVQPNQMVFAISQVPPVAEYGLSTPGGVLAANRDAILSPAERQVNLELPDELPSRVRDYANTVLKNAHAGENNFEKAQRFSLAIQDGAVYTLRPPVLPTGRDAVDYFLFEGQKRGYCTHFASALTVLCRCAGIPARVVSGFVSTDWDSSGTIASLREANAHAWTEIWVDGFGWRVVDATPTEDRGENAPTWIEDWTDLLSTQFSGGIGWAESHLYLFLALVGAAGFGVEVARRRWAVSWLIVRGGLTGFLQPRRQLDDRARVSVQSCYARAARGLARHFRGRAGWETPEEWLSAAYTAINLASPEPLRELTELYMLAMYSPNPLPDDAVSRAHEALRKVKWETVKDGQSGAVPGK